MASTMPNIFSRPYKSPNIPKQNCPSTNPIRPDAFIQLLLICDGNENVSVAIRLVSKQPGSNKIVTLLYIMANLPEPILFFYAFM